mgnify:CR=1 FL=1
MKRWGRRSASGINKALLTREPSAILPTIGNSLFGSSPTTTFALTARSSPISAAVFFVATFDMVATSSSSTVISSSTVRSPGIITDQSREKMRIGHDTVDLRQPIQEYKKPLHSLSSRAAL